WGRRTEAELKAGGAQVLFVKTDVSSEESTRAMAAQAHERFGRIDILVNNAAIFFGMDRQDQSLEYFNRVLSVNLTGVWLCVRAVEPYMKRQRSGKIINQSSTASYMGNIGFIDTSDPDQPS